MLQVGIVGPKESVERIQAETAAYETTFRFKCFEYNSVHEVKELLPKTIMVLIIGYFQGLFHIQLLKKIGTYRRR